MKRLLLSLIILVFSASFSLAADDDSWDSISDIQDLWGKQKVVTDEEFEATIKKFYKPSVKPKKTKHKEVMQPLKNDADNLMPMQFPREKYTALIAVPVQLINSKDIIPPGHYKVAASKNAADEYFINFYQGLMLVSSVKAYVSPADYDEPAINYIKMLPYSQEHVKIIYGSLDYNIEAVLRIFDN